MLTRIRSRSTSVDTSEDSPNTDIALSRQSSSASSFYDSQDSAPLTESAPKRRRVEKTKLSDCKQRVLILPDVSLKGADASGAVSPHFVKFPSPSSGSPGRLCLLSADGSTVYEINKSSEKCRSWFIGDSVQTDGSIFICTPLDPLFLVLPLLTTSKHPDKFTTIEALLACEMNPEAPILSGLVQEEQWLNVCDKKVLPNSVNVYRYNKEKTIKWLTKKVDLLSANLISNRIYVGVGSQTSGYFQSKKGPQIPEEEYLHYASGMIGDYLPLDLRESLLALYPSYLLTGTKQLSDHKNEENTEPLSKKEVTGNAEPTEDYSKLINVVPKPKKTVSSKLSAGQKALAKVDKTGMKSINTFFKKK